MENRMPQSQTMSLDEKLATINQAFIQKKAGDIESYNRLMKTVPSPPYLAKIAKEKISLDFLLSLGFTVRPWLV